MTPPSTLDPRPSTTLGQYVHIPFCRKRCHICYFKVYTDKDSSEVRGYIDALLKELTVYASKPVIGGRKPKFEFGIDGAGTLHLIDEALTPDSSRFWPADQYAEGNNPPSYDKQYVRDYLETLDWGKKAPGPKLPADVIAKTSAKYIEAYERLTGRSL